jgi:hypothetical protein
MPWVEREEERAVGVNRKKGIGEKKEKKGKEKRSKRKRQK